uniref:Uncharacterized protein n=1 Tax=Trieres chinensis TaxID=1514140 RepID=A0A7S2EPX0_TRICV|mmetsp:Transcript_33597/g.68592  ORF Transcript_33597/g.68592 Transcript_33597/m.68592 type:complete len:201 (+) Transcript_33597:58-660(+)|eukprot:CAMPEP_0183300270 /NCGR_PEP_ID=MMETSP0160_2-20130417/6755_1 /TAXON_ID=2839 ORGANISM="Odontella Sinensis, Strain Grunow 1884" /NCGR_SAMPLE_ID=MMETSP0160_2 /ASSEMBLY_ACC=CAM_ASM_000250 /LENGTH=200 /DNA_ID=CAMNT_0025462657 /DNA_START=57 /DNA_END=659 /DNA_ORIENTATION=-
MVRQKSRFILARFDFNADVYADPSSVESPEGELDGRQSIVPMPSGKKRKRGNLGVVAPNAASSPAVVTGKDVHVALRDCLSAAFGEIGAGLSYDVHVKLYDEEARLAIIKCPRGSCGTVRSALTFLTSVAGRSVVVVSVAVCGSARTAKIAGLGELRRSFTAQGGSAGEQQGANQKKARKETEKALVELEERMEKVRAID